MKETLLRTVLDSYGATETKRYAAGFTYRDADGTGASVEALDHLGHAGGRVRYYESGDQLAYQYAFSDHLGNTRVLAEPEGQGVVQTSAYYPYGLRIADLGGGSSTNEELYNGKELTSAHGLGWYHYGARYYDVAIARWTTMDPADQFHSPYTYVGGDPVNRVDPDGRQAYYYNSDGKVEDVKSNWFVDLFLGERYFAAHEQGPVEHGGNNYFRANSRSTVEDGWENVDLDFRTSEFIDRLSAAIPSQRDPRSNLQYALQESRYGGAMDQKLNLNPMDLYLFNGVAYNDNEAGNIVWGATMHYLGFNRSFTSAAAHGGTYLLRGSFDEPWEVRAAQGGWDYHHAQHSNSKFPEPLKRRN